MSDYSELKRLAEAATPQNFDSAQVATHEGWIECPTCGGEGSVDLGGDYLNYDNEALGVQFYGIGDAHVNAEAYYHAAKPAAVLALIAEVDRLTIAAKYSEDVDAIHENQLQMVCYDLAVERDQLKAEVARSTEREIMQLAEIEALRKAVEFGADCFRKISSGDGSGHADLAESILRRAGSAMGKGEQP